MYKARYDSLPEPVSIERQRNVKTGENYLLVRVRGNAAKGVDPEGEREVWVVDENAFSEKQGELDLDAVQANPEAWLYYIPTAIRQKAKDEAQRMLDELRSGSSVVSVPGYREGAAVCNRPADQVKLVAGLAMGGLPYYELASGEVVSLTVDDIRAIAVDVSAAETRLQQAKQACWVAIDAARGDEDIATALSSFAAILAGYETH